MRSQIIRAYEPGHRVLYVRRVHGDGGFSTTYDKAKARAFRPATAREVIARIQPFTRMALDTAEAPA